MKIIIYLLLPSLLIFLSCNTDREEAEFTGAEDEVQLITLNPGHFHAGLIHQNMYPQVDPTVYVYGPEGNEMNSHLELVNRYNTRGENPTSWDYEVYTGPDYLERMLSDRAGNVMVVAGNNARKIEYINQAIENGINVMADKPMIISPDNFDLLKATIESADEQGLLLNDMMTERHAITGILQKLLSQDLSLYGEQLPGTPEDPAIVKESVHFFYKTVAGETLIRPAWFFDVNQQGEAIMDVSTHLVDLILWQLFNEEPIDYTNLVDGVEMVDARTWVTPLTADQYGLITGVEAFPEYLMHEVEGDVLYATANGEFVFKVRDVHGKVSAQWGFTNPDGGDTHYSIMKGSLADLVIHQDIEQNFQATLYVQPTAKADSDHFESTLNAALDGLSDRYPGLSAELTEFGWEIIVPEQFRETHEEHFTRVAERYLDALVSGGLPEWERTNLLTKYYITSQAYEQSR